MNNPAFFICNDKKTILGLICGDKAEAEKCLDSHFTELDPSKSEGAGEKHIPYVTADGNNINVQVGSIMHPMTEEHSIEWVYLETNQGGQLKFLRANQDPIAKFTLTDGETAVAAYAYCNLHGFWKTDL